jgi:DNA processing protein
VAPALPVLSVRYPGGSATPWLEAKKVVVAMDLLAAAAVSMLPASRLKIAAAFKELRHQLVSGSTLEFDVNLLEAILASCAVPDHERGPAAALARQRAGEALAACQSLEILPIPWDDPRFPCLLSCIPDPPPLLWVRGRQAALSQAAVAIVGSRSATSYAMDVAYRLGQELAERGIVIASGLARGVDSAAHRGCLAGGGATIAVLGSGLDRVYPPEHETLARQISCKGCLVSELGPGAAPLPEHFPLRNRIISGISLGVVVVEASEKSGSLITARCALEQGRDVMAVPGSVLTGRNRGSHSLLKDGAKVVESADDILDGLGWPVSPAPPVSFSKSLNSDNLLSRMEAGEVYRLDELMELTGVTGTKLLPRLMELELAGLVTNTGSGFSRRLVT